MKRSQVNQSIAWAMELLKSYRITLPTFADWSPGDWTTHAHEAVAIRQIMLGWDVTDYGLGRFSEVGGVLFTLRNGDVRNLRVGTPYAEKYIMLVPGQKLPMHMHQRKTEDIINRCGGVFCIRLFGADSSGEIDREAQVTYTSDGVEHTVPAGAVVEIANGNSITLTPGLYHEFWCKDAPVVIGEVSTINDDTTDNVFVDEVLRFTVIEEDEPPRYLLCNEYGDACAVADGARDADAV